MTLFAVLMIGFASAGSTMALVQVLYGSELGKRSMISDDPHRSVTDRKLYRDAAINMVVSTSLILAMAYGFERHLFYTGDAPLWVKLVEGASVILVYDFAYYFMHR